MFWHLKHVVRISLSGQWIYLSFGRNQQKPTLAAVLELLPNYLKADVPCPTYNQAYRFIKEKMGNVEAQRGRMGNRELKNLQPFIRRDTEQLFTN